MILERSTHPGWLSNAYLVRDGGSGVVIVDSGAPLAPLIEAIERHRLKLAAVLTTHRHPDHVAGHAEIRQRTGAPVFAFRTEVEHVRGALALEDDEERRFGDLRVRVVHLPGHTGGHVGYLIEEVGLFSGDCLFAGSMGSTMGPTSGGFQAARRSIVERILPLPDSTPVHPGHAGPSTVGHERRCNPFIRVMTALDPEGEQRCLALGRPARLVVLARDFDGATKAWVRYDENGRDVIVPGNRIEILHEN